MPTKIPEVPFRARFGNQMGTVIKVTYSTGESVFTFESDFAVSQGHDHVKLRRSHFVYGAALLPVMVEVTCKLEL